MAGIRVQTNDRRIEVNDQGEYIVLRFSDQSFPGRVFAMIERVQALGEQVKEKEAALRESYRDSEDALALPKAAAALNEEVHRAIMAEVDGVFGAETCRKVFGEIVPDVALFEDFFRQLLPYFEEYGRERAEKMGKYSEGRMGNV